MPMDGQLRVRECASCGSEFSYKVSRGTDRSYCSISCRPRPKAPESICTVHGCVRTVRSGRSPLCEAHYYRLRRTGSTQAHVAIEGPESCEYCGRHTGGRKYCDSRCTARANRSVPLARVCVACSEPFDTTALMVKSVTCSEKCRHERERALAVAHYAKEVQTQKGRDRVRNMGHKRRARKMAAFIDDVSRDTVMRLGDWLCHICNEPIDPELEWPSQGFGTVDHVIPLSKGGAHSYANCKPAHLRCNCAKGARVHWAQALGAGI